VILDTAKVIQVKDPLERAGWAAAYMEYANQMLAELSQIRADAIREATETRSAEETAQELFLTRNSVFRAIGRGKDTEYVDQFGRIHLLVTTLDEPTGMVWVPAELVLSEPKLAWILEEGERLKTTNGTNGAPVYKPSRLKWAQYMKPFYLENEMGQAVDAERDETEWQTRAAKFNEKLRATGRNSEQINAWWNNISHPLLGNRTPMRAWADGDRKAVLAIDP
jgi:hypothetical protein